MIQSGNGDKILKALAKDYVESKRKETSKLICPQRAKVSEELLFRRAIIGSRLEVNTVAVQEKSRTKFNMAKTFGRVSKYGDKQCRALSIFACDFTTKCFSTMFNVLRA